MKHFAAILALCLIAGLCPAAPLVTDSFTGGTDNWAIGPHGAGGAYGSLSNPGGTALGIDGNAAGQGPPPPEDDFYDQDVYNGGDYSGVGSIQFSLQSVGAAPGMLTLYFTDTGSATWYFDIWDLAGTVDSWSSYVVNMDFNYTYGGSSWYRLDAGAETEAAFDASQLIVDEVGFWITYRVNEGGQQFRLDNFILDSEAFVPVPEPSTWATLCAAVLSMLAIFRRRLQALLALVRAR